RPWNIRRNLVIRFNLSGKMLGNADQTFPAAMKTQQALGILRQDQLVKEDRKVIRGMVEVLKPLATVTEVLSRAKVPLIADVILHYDGLTDRYMQMCTNKQQPLYCRNPLLEVVNSFL
ncbi:hypothetical protein FRC07_013783, partial [Ceratobasidium sp. 392]